MAKRILVVDDDPAIRKLLVAGLTPAGYATTAAARGVDALESLRRDGADLVITDVLMPGMDGFRLLDEARRAGHAAPFLFISGAVTEAPPSAAARTGTVGVLPKPLDVGDLLRRVAAALASAPPPPRPVLVADDEPSVRELLGTFLGNAGYRVERAADGAEALDRIRSAPEPHLFAFIDIGMPKLTGPEMIAEVARARPETLYILITGTGTLDDIHEGYRAGAYTLLRKPFDLEAVLRALPSWEAAAGEARAAAERQKALDAQPAHRKAARWVSENVVAPATEARRSRVRTAAVCLLACILGVVLLRAATALHDRLAGEQSVLGAFFDRLEGHLRRGEGYLERDERRELRRER